MPLDLDLGQFQDLVAADGRQYGPFITRTGEGAIESASVNVPRAEVLRAFDRKNPRDITQVHELLRRFDRDDARTLLDAQSKFLERFNITSDDPRFPGEMQRLADAQGGRALLAEARRTAEKYESLVAIDGNPNQEVIRVAEGPDPCELCLDATGTEGTYAELARNKDLPGGNSCLGGDLCLCVIVPIE
jgi:hypothetical protein